MTIAEILKDSNYKLTQFSQEQIEKLEKSITIKTAKDKEAYYTTCLVRKKEIKLTPEETVWLLNNDKLACNDTHFACLFKAQPNDLYINWAAAMQIQFHVRDLDQTYSGTMESWAKSYLKHFVTQAKKRADDMIKKFVKPFEKYIQ